ncbi:hypothetical protein JCM14469_40070 [Desulfatiferula olefinivorans]
MADQRGFTFIEIIVVIVLIGLMFSFALPRMDGLLYMDNRDRVSRWVVLNVEHLKGLSVKKQVRYILHVDISANAFWISEEGMEEDALAEARKSGFALPPDIRLVDIIYPFPGREDDTRSEVFFYPQGYCDHAVIHMENADRDKLSFVIEPFLPPVGIRDGFVMFDE